MAKKKPKMAKKKTKRSAPAKAPLRKKQAKKKAPQKRAPVRKKAAKKPPVKKPAKKTARRTPKPALRPKTQEIRPKTMPPKPVTGQAPSEAERKGPIEITAEIRRLWIRMRQAWVISYDAFNHSVAILDDRQANLMYDVVKHSLFKDSYAEVLRGHPELKELLRTDDDRLCMHDIYERLSYRLNRYEKLPADKMVYQAMKGRIGRNMPDLEV